MKSEATQPCIHCGTPFSTKARPESEFCCNGCAYVHALIHKEGLDRYYDLRGRQIAPVAPASLQPRDYAWLEKLAAGLEPGPDGVVDAVFDLEGISCLGCVWLIEKLFRQQPGALRIDINTQYGQIRMRWRPALFKVVPFAQEIQQFGYLLGPEGSGPKGESQRLISHIGLCGAFALNAMLFTLPRYLGMDRDVAIAPLMELLALLFATLSLLTGGMVFIKRGFHGLAQGILHIDFPIAIGLIVAWTGSLIGWLIGDERFLYFDFVAIFVFLMLIGRWVQERALEYNRNRLLGGNKAPRVVHVVGDDLQGTTTCALEELQHDQRFRVLPGEVVPVLAELESREASLSLEWINGESTMQTHRQGQWIASGAQNIGLEPILLRARQTWQDALLRKLLTSGATSTRNLVVEQVLRVYIGIVLALALGGTAIWGLLMKDWLSGLQVAISVLVVSCPCAIGVAYPLAQEWAVLRLRPFGIFARNNRFLGQLHKVRQIVLDKTGTLTMEAPILRNQSALQSLAPIDKAVLREMVKSSLHPVSRALREAFLLEEQEASAPADLTVEETIGMGLLGRSASLASRWSLGRPGWLAPDGPTAPGDAHFRRDQGLLAAFNFEEALRDDAASLIQSLRSRFPVYLLSGDRSQKVAAMAQRLGLEKDAAIGEQVPEAKAAFVVALGKQGTLYVGDGANDALAFDCSMIRGTPATPHGLLQDRADFYLTGKSLHGVLALFRVAHLRRRAVHLAFGFAILYNIAVVTVALFGYMHPLLAAILMPLSSLATIGLVALVYKRGQSALRA